MSIKMIYLAKRNPASTHVEFLENWKGHSALTAQFPRIREHIVQVAQCSSIQETTILPEATRDFDGLNLLTMRSLLNSLEIWDDPDSRTVMREDELRVFSTYAKDFTLFADDHVLIDGPMCPVVVVYFLRRRTDIDRETFIKKWTGEQARALMSIPLFRAKARRFVHNHRILDAPPRYDYDGVAEMWFDDVEDVRGLFADSEFRAVFFSGAEAFVDGGRSDLLLTQVNLARPPIGSAA